MRRVFGILFGLAFVGLGCAPTDEQDAPSAEPGWYEEASQGDLPELAAETLFMAEGVYVVTGSVSWGEVARDSDALSVAATGGYAITSLSLEVTGLGANGVEALVSLEVPDLALSSETLVTEDGLNELMNDELLPSLVGPNVAVHAILTSADGTQAQGGYDYTLRIVVTRFDAPAQCEAGAAPNATPCVLDTGEPGVCEGGQCGPSDRQCETVLDCDDGNPCTVDAWSASACECETELVTDGVSCRLEGSSGLCEDGLCRECPSAEPCESGPLHDEALNGDLPGNTSMKNLGTLSSGFHVVKGSVSAASQTRDFDGFQMEVAPGHQVSSLSILISGYQGGTDALAIVGSPTLAKGTNAPILGNGVKDFVGGSTFPDAIGAGEVMTLQVTGPKSEDASGFQYEWQILVTPSAPNLPPSVFLASAGNGQVFAPPLGEGPIEVSAEKDSPVTLRFQFSDDGHGDAGSHDDYQGRFEVSGTVGVDGQTFYGPSTHRAESVPDTSGHGAYEKTFTFPEAGSYTVTGVVRDPHGSSGSLEFNVVVAEPTFAVRHVASIDAQGSVELGPSLVYDGPLGWHLGSHASATDVTLSPTSTYASDVYVYSPDDQLYLARDVPGRAIVESTTAPTESGDFMVLRCDPLLAYDQHISAACNATSVADLQTGGLFVFAWLTSPSEGYALAADPITPGALTLVWGGDLVPGQLNHLFLVARNPFTSSVGN